MELLYFFICFTKAIFLPIPESMTIVAGSVAFGSFKGFIIGFLGIISGIIAAYLISRFLGIKFARKFIKEHQLNKFARYIKKNEILTIGLLFIIPVFPDCVICAGAGIMEVSFGTFVIIAAFSKIFTCFSLAYSVQITNMLPLTKLQLLIVQLFLLLIIAFINYLTSTVWCQLFQGKKL